MKLSFRSYVFAAALLVAGALAGTIGPVQRAISQGMVQIFVLTGTEQISLNYPCTVSCFVSSATLANYGQTQPGGNAENALIGGDAGTNLFQRGTTGSSVTATVTYGGPDRWAYWSGASTAMTVSQDTTAADLPASKDYNAGFKMARTSGQTGVLPVCMIQVLESINSYAFSGKTAELDFHATAGANFSAASSVMTASFITGTSTDEGAAKAGFGLNAGGGGGAGWTGQANVSVNVTISTTNNRYTVVGPIPAGTTELAVALCFTPVGTAGTNDYIAFSGLQLTRNVSLASVAGTAGASLPINDTRAKTFARRSAALEAAMQYRYYYRINEVNTAGVVQSPGGQYDTVTSCSIAFPLPSPMRATPTADLGNLAATTFTVAPGSVASPVVLGTPFGKIQVGNTSTTMGAFSFITTTETIHNSCVLLSTAAGGGKFGFNAEL